jgi:hypothetical protein
MILGLPQGGWRGLTDEEVVTVESSEGARWLNGGLLERPGHSHRWLESLSYAGMNSQERTEALLIEIRDLQRQQLSAHERQAARAIELAEESVNRQRRALRLVAAVVTAFVLWLLLAYLVPPFMSQA